jgi:hypothetical protein
MYLSGKDNKINTPDMRKRRTLNDDVQTHPQLAKRIVEYFQPQFQLGDVLLEPCRGEGAFYDNFPDGYDKHWCEIDEDRDFLQCQLTHVNWTITNFPWSGKVLRPLVRKAASISDNLVHLIRIHNILGTSARQRDYMEQGHTLKEIIMVPWKDAFINKRSEGFCLGVFHTQKNYTGDCRFTYWK